MVAYVSPSQVTTYKRCPRRWGWDKLDGIKQPETEALRFGTELHAQLERYMKDGTLPSDATPEGRLAKRGLHMLPKRNTRDLVIEEKFRFHGLHCYYLGIKDLSYAASDTVVVVHDHKTTAGPKWVKSVDELVNDPQGIIYPESEFRDLPHLTHVRLDWLYFFKKGNKPPKLVSATVSREETAERFAKLIEPTAALISEARLTKKTALELPYNPGACSDFGGCPYQRNCNLSPKDRVIMASQQLKSPTDLIASLGKLGVAPSNGATPPAPPQPATVSGSGVPAIPAQGPAPESDSKAFSGQGGTSTAAPGQNGLRTPATAQQTGNPGPLLGGLGNGSALAPAVVPPPPGINPPETELPPPPDAAPPPPDLTQVAPPDGDGATPKPDKPKRQVGRPRSKNKSKLKMKDLTPALMAKYPAQEGEETDQYLARVEAGEKAEAKAKAEAEAKAKAEAEAKAKAEAEAKAVQQTAPATPPSPQEAPLADFMGFTLYVNCIPTKGDTHYVRAIELVEQMHAAIREAQGVHHYKLIEYGQGPGLLSAAVAAALAQSPPRGDVFIDSRIPECADAMSAFENAATRVVRGV